MPLLTIHRTPLGAPLTNEPEWLEIEVQCWAVEVDSGVLLEMAAEAQGWPVTLTEDERAEAEALVQDELDREWAGVHAREWAAEMRAHAPGRV